MTHEAQRIAIAEACGWTLCHATGGLPCGVPPGFIHEENSRQVPNYTGDLNSMHEAEKVLTRQQQSEYAYQLSEIVAPITAEDWCIAHATAAQRAEAFLRTLTLTTCAT